MEGHVFVAEIDVLVTEEPPHADTWVKKERGRNKHVWAWGHNIDPEAVFCFWWCQMKDNWSGIGNEEQNWHANVSSVDHFKCEEWFHLFHLSQEAWYFPVAPAEEPMRLDIEEVANSS